MYRAGGIFVKANMTTATAATTLDTLETVFKALADKTRLRILALLGGEEVCVCHLHDTLRLPQPTVSRHLSYLRRARLVDVRRDGVWMHYRLSAAIDPVVRAVIDAAVHAVTHAPTAHKDRRQFAKAFGDSRTTPASHVVPCCAARP
jgi:ArsR family transcriptional regulator